MPSAAAGSSDAGIEGSRMTFSVRFEPWGTEVACGEGETLLDAARRAEIPLGAVCSGRGTCGKCQLRVVKGPLPDATSVERMVVSQTALERGYRLACQHPVAGDSVVETLPILSHGKDEAPPLERAFEFAPPVKRHIVRLEPPSLERPVDDASNLLAALASLAPHEGPGAPEVGRVDFEVARILSPSLRAARWHLVASVREGEVIAVRPPAALGVPSLGLAVDLGTTNIAAYLYRLDDGTLLSVLGASNPLSTYGADIISRLAYAQHSPEYGAKLQRVLIKALNLLLEQGTRSRGYSPEDVEEMVLVGNAGMHHLFLNLPGRQLIYAPFVTATRSAMAIKARDLGLQIAAGAYVYLPPLVGGFVGSDLLAVALSTRIDLLPGVRLALDIGTNTELLLAVDGELFSCSTASGPALEGAALRFGSVAMAGVVDHVWIESQGAPLGYRTIKNKPAIGICGSGIIEALAAMRHTGIINTSGRLQAGNPLVTTRDGGDHLFTLVPAGATGLGTDLTISQTDIRAIQLAKGAIRAGIDTLLAEHGMGTDAIDEILVAGAFGQHIRVESALQIGLFPPVRRERIRQIGNAAGTGAGLILLSETERQEAVELSNRINYLELATHRRFTKLFAKSQWFPAGADEHQN